VGKSWENSWDIAGKIIKNHHIEVYSWENHQKSWENPPSMEEKSSINGS